MRGALGKKALRVKCRAVPIKVADYFHAPQLGNEPCLDMPRESRSYTIS